MQCGGRSQLVLTDQFGLSKKCNKGLKYFFPLKIYSSNSLHYAWLAINVSGFHKLSFLTIVFTQQNTKKQNFGKLSLNTALNHFAKRIKFGLIAHFFKSLTFYYERFHQRIPAFPRENTVELVNIIFAFTNNLSLSLSWNSFGVRDMFASLCPANFVSDAEYDLSFFQSPWLVCRFVSWIWREKQIDHTSTIRFSLIEGHFSKVIS